MKIYLDTFVFMDILSGKSDLAKKALSYMQKNNECFVSTVVLSELAYHIKRKKGVAKAEEILHYVKSIPNVKIIPVSHDIATEAGKMRAKYHNKLDKTMTYFDAIHVATALNNKCDKFITGDKGLKGIKEIEIEVY